jgi:hypothetical protein
LPPMRKKSAGQMKRERKRPLAWGFLHLCEREIERVQLQQQPWQSLPTKHSTQNALQQNRVRTARILFLSFLLKKNMSRPLYFSPSLFFSTNH